MELTILGSGTSIPHPQRTGSAYWLETTSCSILLDCSPTAPARLAAESLPWHDVDAIWISHFHLDHVGGLLPLLGGMRYFPAARERQKPLSIYGPRGIKELIRRFDVVRNYRSLELPFAVEIVEVEPEETFAIGPGVQAMAWKTPHTAESCALQISDGYRKLAYTSDTSFTPLLAAFAQGCDLLVIECSFVEKKPVDSHLELAEAMHIIRRAKPQRAILSHLEAVWDEVDGKKLIAGFSPPCQVELAADGMRVKV